MSLRAERGNLPAIVSHRPSILIGPQPKRVPDAVTFSYNRFSSAGVNPLAINLLQLIVEDIGRFLPLDKFWRCSQVRPLSAKRQDSSGVFHSRHGYYICGKTAESICGLCVVAVMCDCRPKRKRHRIIRGGCVRRDPGPLLRSYADVVRDYQKKFRQGAADNLRFYAKQKTLAEAVRLATLAQTADGKRQSHQRRIPGAVLHDAYTELKRRNFKGCLSFYDLHQMIHEAIRSIHGIGELVVYDTARRIGAYLQLEPQKVYLHAGARVGARAMGLGKGTKVLEVEELPVEFHRLTAGDIENCLCIYKKDLKRISGR
jgi:hypothetical protein